MSSKTVFVFRHGETNWNKERRLQGHTDIPLNEQGRSQAQSLADLLLPHAPEVFLTSDLSRAHETALIANKILQKPMHISEALRECRMGEPEGFLRDEVAAKFGAEAWNRWISPNPEDRDYAFPGGESKKQHLHRMLLHIEDFVVSNKHYERFVVSTHGGSLHRIIQNCINAPADLLVIPNCALFRLQFNVNSKEWSFGELIQS